MQGFQTEQLGAETLSEMLIRLRAERGLSIEDIVAETKIQRRYIEALEEGRYEDLPAPVYLRGFLRSLAEQLDIDDVTLLQQFHREQSLRRRLKGQPLTPTTQSSFLSSRRLVPKIVFTPRLLAAVAVVGFFVVVAGYLLYQVGTFTSTPTVSLERPDRDLTIQSASITVIGSTDPNVEILVNGQEVFVDSDGRFTTNLTLQDGRNEVIVVGRNRSGRETTVVRNVLVER